MRVAVVAEYYPRLRDPAWGIWAHRQAMAAREHGVEVRVPALDRPLPSRRDVGALPILCRWRIGRAGSSTRRARP